MKVRIDIDTRTFVRFWLVVIGFALVAFMIYSARTALIILGAAVFVAVILSPSVNYLAKIFPSKSRILGTALAYVAVVAALGVIIFLVIPPVVDQTAKFAQTVPHLIDSASKQYAGVNSFINHYNLQPEFTKVVNSVKDNATQFASGIGSFLITGIGSVLTTIAAGFLTLVLAFLMLVEGPTWLSRLWATYGDKERMEYHSKILTRMYNVITSFATGQLSVSSIAGLVAGVLALVLCVIFGISFNLVIPAAAIVFVLSLIPMFGEITGATIVCLILALSNITAGVIFILFFLLYTQVEGNFILPKIQSKHIKLSALAVLVSITIGIYLFGIVGGIISIPIAGCVNVLIEDHFARAKKKRSEEDKTPEKLVEKVEIKL